MWGYAEFRTTTGITRPRQTTCRPGPPYRGERASPWFGVAVYSKLKDRLSILQELVPLRLDELGRHILVDDFMDQGPNGRAKRITDYVAPDMHPLASTLPANDGFRNARIAK
jgi:hypothetical protein